MAKIPIAAAAPSAGSPAAARDPVLEGLSADFSCRVPGFDAAVLVFSAA